MLARAKKNLDKGLTQIKRWWTERYKLPPNHELFMCQSVAEVTQDMYEDLLFQKEEVEQDLENARGGSADVLLNRLNAINRVLGLECQVQDDLFDQWERDLEEGRVPDLEAKPGED